MKRYLRIMAVSLLMFSSPSWAENISVQNTQPMSFGSFVAGSGGTITVDTNGSRSAGGGVTLIPSSYGVAAEFVVNGDPNTTYNVQLPADDLNSLTGPGAEMSLTNFTSVPSGANGQIGSGGSQVLSVGATLNAGNNQARGNYSGSFTVIVDYN